MPNVTLDLVSIGAAVDVMVGVSEPLRDALAKAGKPIPTPINIRALIDTGASSSAISPSVVERLKLEPRGTVPIHTPSTADAPHETPQFDVCIIFTHPRLTWKIPAVPVISVNMHTQGVEALLGRDILNQCLLIYNGPGGDLLSRSEGPTNDACCKVLSDST